MKKLKDISTQDYDIVYYAKKASCIMTAMTQIRAGGNKDNGGLFARLDSSLDLTINDFIFYDT